MYAITGATGNTGRVIAEWLLEAGQLVRVIGRSAERLQPFVQKGAEAFVGVAEDAAAMTRAFTGATAVYAMIPPDMTSPDYRAYQERISDAYAAAIEKAGVTHAVTLSSVGADKSETVGPVNGLQSFEQKLNRIAILNVLHLRAGYFMENLFQYIKLIKSMGMLAGTLKGDLPVPMIATRDIAAVTANALLRRDFSGKKTRELLGPRDVTHNAAAKIIGKAIGKDSLSYSQVPAIMIKGAMAVLGVSSDVGRLLLEMFDAMNSGWMRPLESRSGENTTPTTIEQFIAEEFIPRYQSKAAGA